MTSERWATARRGQGAADPRLRLRKKLPEATFPVVRTVGLKVLKNKLSEYVRLASRGETVLIADRDRVVAELVPPQPGRAETVSDAVLASLVREAVVTPALLPPGTRPRTPPPTEKLRDVLAGLDTDRTER